MAKTGKSNDHIHSQWNKTNESEETLSYNEIWQALYDNSYAQLEAALTRDSSAINSKGTGYLKGETPLIFSANTGRTSFVRLLLRFGAELTHLSVQNKTALEIAQEKEFEDVITELTEYQKKLDALSVSDKVFHIHVLEGQKLRESGKADPFVRIAWDVLDTKIKLKTPHLSKTVDPKWENCVFDLPQPEIGKTKNLLLTVYHYESLGRHEFLGRAALQIETLMNLYPGPTVFNLKLGPKVDKKKDKKDKKEKKEKITGSLKIQIYVTLKQKLKPQLHFGRALGDSIKTAKDEKCDHCIDLCLKSLYNKEALLSEGIIRIPGSKPQIYSLKDQFDDGLSVNLENEDPFVVAGLLKLYFYSLPDALFPQRSFLEAEGIQFEGDDISMCIHELRVIVQNVPEPNLRILKKLVNYFRTLASYSDVNKMDVRAISISIGPSIVIAPDIREDAIKFVSATKVAPTLMQFLMNYAKDLGLIEEDNIEKVDSIDVGGGEGDGGREGVSERVGGEGEVKNNSKGGEGEVITEGEGKDDSCETRGVTSMNLDKDGTGTSTSTSTGTATGAAVGNDVEATATTSADTDSSEKIGKGGDYLLITDTEGSEKGTQEEATHAPTPTTALTPTTSILTPTTTPLQTTSEAASVPSPTSEQVTEGGVTVVTEQLEKHQDPYIINNELSEQ